MNRLNLRIIVFIISIFLFVGTIGLMVAVSQIGKQTEETTSDYIATVKDVHIVDSEKNIYAEIYINEYDTSLYISTNICESINVSDISNLKNGDKIFFRIESIKDEQMNNVDFINIVSLKNETEDIFSLEEYNEFTNNSAYPARMAGIVLMLIFGAISCISFLSVRRNKNL